VPFVPGQYASGTTFSTWELSTRTDPACVQFVPSSDVSIVTAPAVAVVGVVMPIVTAPYGARPVYVSAVFSAVALVHVALLCAGADPTMGRARPAPMLCTDTGHAFAFGPGAP
jgi:hypothetical protein